MNRVYDVDGMINRNENTDNYLESCLDILIMVEERRTGGGRDASLLMVLLSDTKQGAINQLDHDLTRRRHHT
jgi:hypothetical protein